MANEFGASNEPPRFRREGSSESGMEQIPEPTTAMLITGAVIGVIFGADRENEVVHAKERRPDIKQVTVDGGFGLERQRETPSDLSY